VRRVPVALAAVALTAVGSALVTTHREASADDAAAERARAGVAVRVLDPGENSLPLPDQGSRLWSLRVRNEGGAALVLHSARWVGTGDAVTVDKSLRPNDDRTVRLPLGDCPQHRLTEGFEEVEAVVRLAGTERTVRLRVPDPEGPLQRLNESCGLFSVRDSLGSGVGTLAERRGHVQLSISLGIGGTRDTELLSVTAADGVRATVKERLPLTVAARDDDVPTREDVLTVTLDLVDSAPLEARSRTLSGDEEDLDRAPFYDEVQLALQHPGEPVETVNVRYLAASANALAAACDVPDIPAEEQVG
jgi:hypothetical protein